MTFRMAGICLALALSVITGGPAGAQEQGPPLRMAPPATDRFIVKFKPALQSGRAQALALEDRAGALAQRHGLAVRMTRSLGPDLSVVAIAADDPRGALQDRLAALQADPAVEFVEPDHRRVAHAVPSDPLFSSQWFLQATEESGTRLSAAWDEEAGENDTVIAILDTGIRFEHPDLRRVSEGGRLLPGYDFVSGENASSFLTANDGDDWDPDPSDPGDWLAPSDLNLVHFALCGDPVNSSWHGTRVAGMVGAITNNGAGIAGGTWNGRILPVRVLGKCGGYDSDIIAAMRWSAGLAVSGVPANPNPAKVINLSLGSVTSCSGSYRNVMTELTAAGVLVVASAGNETGPVNAPANCPGVLAVAGLRHVGTKVGYSSFGPEVEVSAPAGNCVNEFGACLFSLITTDNAGVTVPDTTPGGSTYTDEFNYNIGTSFSAPLVAAIAGLMHGANDQLAPADYIARIQASARPFPVEQGLPTCPSTSGSSSSFGQCNCTATTCGAGMADAAGALAEAQRPIARIAALGSVVRGQDLALDGTPSRAARDRSVAAYQWSVVTGTGVTIANPTLPNASVTVPTTGTLTVRLTVTDDEGATDFVDVAVVTSGGGGGGGGGGASDFLVLCLLAAVLGTRRYRRP